MSDTLPAARAAGPESTDRSGTPPGLRSSLGLGVAMAIGNALGYVFVLVVSRALGPADFGAFSAVNNIGLLFLIPGGALQVVIARHQRDRAHESGVGVALAVGVGLCLLGSALAPLAMWAFHLDSVWPVVLVMTVLVPMSVVAALQGVLLGRARLKALASVYLVTAGTKVAAAVVVARVGGGVSAVFASMLVAGVLTVVWAAWLCRRPLRRSRLAVDRAVVGELVRSTRTLAALIALASADVLLARHFLSDVDSGFYAFASLFGRAVFWGTQFVAISIVPAFHPKDARKRVFDAAGLVLLLGGLATAVAALAPGLLVRWSGGEQYLNAQGLLMGFTILGTLWALAQVLLFADMASDRGGLGLLAWAMVLVEVLVVILWQHGNAFRIIATAGAATLVVVVAGLVHIWRSSSSTWPEQEDMAADLPLLVGGAPVDEHGTPLAPPLHLDNPTTPALRPHRPPSP